MHCVAPKLFRGGYMAAHHRHRDCMWFECGDLECTAQDMRYANRKAFVLFRKHYKPSDSATWIKPSDFRKIDQTREIWREICQLYNQHLVTKQK